MAWLPYCWPWRRSSRRITSRRCPSPRTPPTVEELQRQIEELTRQLQAVQQQLEALKAQQEAQEKQAELDTMRQAAMAEAAKEGPSETLDTGTEFASGTRMQPQLNPEISVTGDIFFVDGDHLKTRDYSRATSSSTCSPTSIPIPGCTWSSATREPTAWGFEDEDHAHGRWREQRARRGLLSRRGICHLVAARSDIVDRRQQAAAVRRPQPLAHARPAADRLSLGHPARASDHTACRAPASRSSG